MLNAVIAKPRASKSSRMRWVSYWLTLQRRVMNAAVGIRASLLCTSMHGLSDLDRGGYVSRLRRPGSKGYTCALQAQTRIATHRRAPAGVFYPGAPACVKGSLLTERPRDCSVGLLDGIGWLCYTEVVLGCEQRILMAGCGSAW